jgi:hypothetical protein
MKILVMDMTVYLSGKTYSAPDCHDALFPASKTMRTLFAGWFLLSFKLIAGLDIKQLRSVDNNGQTTITPNPDGIANTFFDYVRSLLYF